MFLPVEIIERIASFFMHSDQQRKAYLRALKAISSLSPYFFERMRYVRYKNINFEICRIRLKMDYAPPCEAEHLYFEHRSADTVQPFPLELWRYVKHLTVSDMVNSYLNFNKIMRGPMHLDSFSCGSNYVNVVLHVPINSEHIVRLKTLTNYKLPGLLQRLPDSSIQSLEVVKANQNSSSKFFLLLMAELSLLRPETVLHFSYTVNGEAPLVTVPVDVLHVRIEHDWIAKLDCIAFPERLKVLSFDIQPDNFDYDYIIDDFVSSAVNLQELTIKKFSFPRSSLLAFLKVANTLKHMRFVTFEHNKYRNSANFPSLGKVSFRFQNGKLDAIEYTDLKFLDAESRVNPLDWLVELMFDMTTFTVKNAFIEEIFGVVGGVNFKYKRRERVVKTREEYDLNVATYDSEDY